jgi:colicin import membrane protein
MTVAATTTPQHLEFAPPPDPGGRRSLILALLVHALLVAALTWGISWNSQDTASEAEAELWSAIPQAAAPKAVEPPPPPPPPPAPTPKPSPKPAPPPKAAPTPQRDADLAIEKKKKLEKEKLEKEKKLEEERKQKEAKREQARKEAAKREQEDKEKLKREQADKKAKAEKEAKERAEAEKRMEAQRQENLKRIAGMAGASGGPTATGTALKASGPSASYGGLIRAKVKPNITFTEDISGNPTAEVEVQCAPDGTIVSRKLLKSSGNKGWDDAVLNALDKTEKLPRDTDGRVPSSMVITFRPRD